MFASPPLSPDTGGGCGGGLPTGGGVPGGTPPDVFGRAGGFESSLHAWMIASEPTIAIVVAKKSLRRFVIVTSPLQPAAYLSQRPGKSRVSIRIRMRRSTLIGATVVFLAVGGVGIWFARRPSTRDAIASPAATVTAIDSTWCGSQLGAPIGDASDCGKLGLTGSAPSCLFFADCEHDHYVLDCTSGRCKCEGGPKPPIVVPYDAKFCALDATSPSQSLHAILESAAAACKWRESP
jgi:hypothetical protein